MQKITILELVYEFTATSKIAKKNGHFFNEYLGYFTSDPDNSNVFVILAMSLLQQYQWH